MFATTARFAWHTDMPLPDLRREEERDLHIQDSTLMGGCCSCRPSIGDQPCG